MPNPGILTFGSMMIPYPHAAKVEDAADPQGVKGDAVVGDRETLTRPEMGYPRLSRRVKNRLIFHPEREYTSNGFLLNP